MEDLEIFSSNGKNNQNVILFSGSHQKQLEHEASQTHITVSSMQKLQSKMNFKAFNLSTKQRIITYQQLPLKICILVP